MDRIFCKLFPVSSLCALCLREIIAFGGLVLFSERRRIDSHAKTLSFYVIHAWGLCVLA